MEKEDKNHNSQWSLGAAQFYVNGSSVPGLVETQIPSSLPEFLTQ